MLVPRGSELHEVAMSDRGTEPTDEAFQAVMGSDDIADDLLDELDPVSDIDDVAFGLDVNPDDVDLTFDPTWQPSVSDRGWGERADRAWGDPTD